MDADQVRSARRLIDGGVDLVHGRSSLHPRPIEVYRGKSLDPDTGQLTALHMAPMQARKMWLHQAPAADEQGLRAVLDRISHGFGSRVDLAARRHACLAPGASLSGTAGKNAEPH